jgi:hypothetical protein
MKCFPDWPSSPHSLSGRARPITAPAPHAQTGAGGQGSHEESCRKCHGVRGVPPKNIPAKYFKIPTFDAVFFEKHSKDSIVTAPTKATQADTRANGASGGLHQVIRPEAEVEEPAHTRVGGGNLVYRR